MKFEEVKQLLDAGFTAEEIRAFQKQEPEQREPEPEPEQKKEPEQKQDPEQKPEQQKETNPEQAKPQELGAAAISEFTTAVKELKNLFQAQNIRRDYVDQQNNKTEPEMILGELIRPTYQKPDNK